MKFFVETFGCQMNEADGREMGRALLARGLIPADKPEEADCILVNTCAVRQHAEDKAASALGRLAAWRAADPSRILILAGCAAERWGQAVKRRFPYVDLVVGAKSLPNFDECLDGKLPRPVFDGPREEKDAWGHYSDERLLPGETLSAFVTVMRGCNYSCSYCIVPSVRGREVYRPAGSILSEVRRKAALGVKTIMLLGQTVNSYRPSDGGDISDFAGLLRAVSAVPGVERVEFMSAHPFYVNEAMVRAMADSEKVARWIHLPVQSGSDDVLKRMRRNYTRGDFLGKADLLRSAMPGIFVTTDFIVGFPGETEEDFQRTLSLFDEGEFNGAFVFKYSARPGTPSADWADDIPETIKEDRHARLLGAVMARSTRKAPAGLV